METVEVVVAIIGLVIVCISGYTGLVVKNLDGKMKGLNELLQKDLERINEATLLRKEKRDFELEVINNQIKEMKQGCSLHKTQPIPIQKQYDYT